MNSIYSEFLKLKRSMSRDPRIPGLARRAQESNWNALMSRPVPTSEVVLGKVAAIAALAASLQLVLLVTVIGLGKLVFGLEGMLPAKYLLGSLLIMLACVPLAALQSALSAFLRSFATPVTIALVDDQRLDTASAAEADSSTGASLRPGHPHHAARDVSRLGPEDELRRPGTQPGERGHRHGRSCGAHRPHRRHHLHGTQSH